METRVSDVGRDVSGIGDHLRGNVSGVKALGELFTACLRRGYFPRAWAVLRAVPIPKKESDGSVGARGIVISEAFRAVYARMLAKRLLGMVRPRLFAVSRRVGSARAQF